MGELDRRKHDVDIIERVLGGIRDSADTAEGRTHVVDVDLPPSSEFEHPTLELTVSLEDLPERGRSPGKS